MQNEKKLSRIIGQTTKAAYLCDENGFVQVFNQAAADLWGRSPVPGKDRWCGSVQRFNKHGVAFQPGSCPVAAALRDGHTSLGLEMILQRADGTLISVSLFSTLLYNDSGELSGVMNQLSETAVNGCTFNPGSPDHCNLINDAADGILRFDQKGRVVTANIAALKMLAYEKYELQLLQLKDIFPEINKETLVEKRSRLNAGAAILVEKKMQKKDGTVFYAELSAQLTEDGNIQALIRDITDRKIAEAKMRKATERYDLLCRATSDTIWDWDIVADKVVYNEGIYKMFGYDSLEINDPRSWWKTRIHDFDWKKVSEGIDDVFARRAPHLQISYRFKCADGSFKNIYDRAFVLFDENGTPVRMIGAMQDVTYLRQEESRIMKATIDAQESERQQIGFELHDNINQILTGCLLNLCTIKHVSAERTSELVDLSREYILTAIDEIRKLSHRLAPAQFDKLSMRESFEGLIRFMNIGNQFQVKMDFGNLKKQFISNDIQLNLYRILQEQLTNIVKYSEASQVELSVTMKDDAIVMRIADNGIGFDAANVQLGIGINSMKRRTHVLSGVFAVNSSEGNGCELVVEIPLNPVSSVRLPLTA